MRRFGIAQTVLALTLSLVIVGPPQQASALSACQQSPIPSADVELTQTATGSTDGSTWTVNYVLLLINHGPCQIPGLVVTDDLEMSGPATWRITSTTPGSWSCVPSSGSVPSSGPTPSFRCTLTANLGVPGNGSISLQVTWTSEPKNVTNHAVLTQNPSSVLETNLDNDETWSGATFGTGYIQDGPYPPSTQTHRVSAGQGIGAQVTHTAGCGSVTNCLGGLTIGIAVNGGGYNDSTHPLTLVFIYTLDASGNKKPTEIVIFHNGSAVSPCSKTVPPAGCVKSAKQATIGGQKYNVITITTPTNGDWSGQ